MRLDRFITLNVVQPLRRAFGCVPDPGLSSDWTVPVLMYHNISDDLETGTAAYYRTNTSPSVFRQHVQFLVEHGYRTISVAELVRSLTDTRRGQSLGEPRRGDPDGAGGHLAKEDQAASGRCSTQPWLSGSQPVVILTFDDAFRSVYTEAFPVLRQHGLTGTVFLPTAFIGDTRRQFRPVSGSRPVNAGSAPNASLECVTWAEVGEMSRCGIEFGSHTVNHPELVKSSWSEVESELSMSKAEIERHVQRPASTFCYPFAFPQANRSFIAGFRRRLVDAGYTCCLTTQLGSVKPGDDRFCIKRLPANSLDDGPLLGAKLTGAYNWLAIPQQTAKKCKSLLRFSSSQNGN
jgi:peptidoglycan/xylan/chitin deacetylase (PgdA/CDA1 family)